MPALGNGELEDDTPGESVKVQGHGQASHGVDGGEEQASFIVVIAFDVLLRSLIFVSRDTTRLLTETRLASALGNSLNGDSSSPSWRITRGIKSEAAVLGMGCTGL